MLAQPQQNTFSIEGTIEAGLFGSRWILAPIYMGLVLALVMLVFEFARQLASSFPELLRVDGDQVILTVLSLIDLSLTGNLVLIVIFSGYENFVSKIHTGDNEDRPSWMGTLDFSGLKMKLIGSIVAISAISLLRTFISVVQAHAPLDERRLLWLVVLHLTFLASGVLFAIMDWVSSRAEKRAFAEGHRGPAAP